MRRLPSILALGLAGWSLLAPAGRAEEGWGGLPPGPGREEVFTLCNACHSLAIVKQQGLSRRVWDETLVWMVEEQGMPALDRPARDQVLDYLAEHYGPDRKAAGR